MSIQFLDRVSIFLNVTSQTVVPINLCTNFVHHLVAKAAFHVVIASLKIIFVGTLITLRTGLIAST